MHTVKINTLQSEKIDEKRTTTKGRPATSEKDAAKAANCKGFTIQKAVTDERDSIVRSLRATE